MPRPSSKSTYRQRRKTRKKKSWWSKISTDTKRFMLVVVISIVVALISTIVARILEDDYEPHYPHDDRLYQEKTEDGINPGME